MKIIYQGVDISKKVYVNRCEHETFAEKRADWLKIRFTDSSGLWNAWEPKSGDTIQFIKETADTGKMYISSIHPENGLITFYATSMPPSSTVIKNRTWENFRLLEIGEDIAAEHGLTFKSYGVTDRIYSYICQENQSDFDFYQTRCLLEGCAMVVYDGCLIIYDERSRENSSATATIRVGEDGVFEFQDRAVQRYSSAEIISGNYRGIYYDNTIKSDRILRPRKEIECASNEEALRFARGILRDANKNAYTGSFRRKITYGFAAGSIVNLAVTKESKWDGKVFITRTRTDYANGETKIFFRRPLEDY